MTMTRFSATLFGCVALVAAAPAAAQTSEASKAAAALVDTLNPPAAAKAQADRQIAQIRSGAGVRAMLSQNPQVKAALDKKDPKLEAGIGRMGAIQADAVGPIIREMQASTRTQQIASFAKMFTVDELNQLTAFYRSPTGAKFLARQGQVMAETARANAAKYGPRMQAAEKAAAPKLNAELKKLFPQAGQ